MNLLLILTVCFLGSALSLALAFAFSKLKMVNYADYFVSFAVGTLLGAAFLEIIPHAYDLSGDLHKISLVVLVGILIFFILEKLLVWRHCHGSHCEHHSPAPNIDINLGFITALAIIVHEIPQEISNFSILLNSGYSLVKTLWMNIITGISMMIGAAISFFILSDFSFLIPFILSLAASSMIYVAISDLIPTLHKKTQMQQTFQQTSSIFLGVIVIYLLHSMIH